MLKYIEFCKQRQKPMSEQVDQDLVKQLMELGFEKSIAEAAIFNSGSVEKALEWIEQYQKGQQ